MEKKTCNGCHHIPLLLWSNRLAIERGFTVDQKKFEEWTNWAEEWTPEAKAMEKGGMEELALRILALPDRPVEKMVSVITTNQQADGSWKPAGQFATMQARDADAKENAARLFLLALGAPNAPQNALAGAQTKAAGLLAKKETAKSVDTLVHRLQYAQRFGPAEEVDATRKEILKQQRGDGGWSWIIGVNQSDPLATGEVLHALAAAPEKTSAAAIDKATAWLLKAQREDGSWFTDFSRISKIDRSAPDKANSFQQVTEIYHYWGSAWATIGLLQTLPVEAPKGE